MFRWGKSSADPEKILKIKEEGRGNKIYLPSKYGLFSSNDRTRLARESQIQTTFKKLSDMQCYGYKTGNNAQLMFPVKELYAWPHTYKSGASKNSRRSCMSLVAKMEDGNTYPTTAALDPFFRAPVLGKYLEECEEEEESEEEIARGLPRPRRIGFALKAGIRNPGRANEVTEEIIKNNWRPEDEGRNILSMYEFTYFFARHSTKGIDRLRIPVKAITADYLTEIIIDLLKGTKGPYELPQGMTRDDKEELLGKILSCYGFPEESWTENIWLMCSGKTFEGKAQTYEQHFQTSSGNIYKIPIFVDKSVVDKIWNKKPQVLEISTNSESYVPQPKLKRPIQDVTIYESTSKQTKEDVSLQSIGDGIHKLGEIAGQVLAQRGDSRKGILIEEHAELAEDLLEKIKTIQLVTDNELEEVKKEKNYVVQQLEHKSSLLRSYQEELTQVQQTLDKVETEKSALQGRLEEATSSETYTEETRRLEEYADRQKELENSLQFKSEIIEKMKEEHMQLQQKFSDLVHKMDESLKIKESVSAMDISLTDSVKKNMAKFSRDGLSPIKSGLNNPAYESDTDDDDEFHSAERTVRKPTRSIAAMTLTPNKIGLKPWDPNLQNFSQWFSSMRMQIETAQQTVEKESAVVRLILMCLPSKYSWVTNTIADDTTIDTIDKAKKQILKLIYGERGLMEDFFALKMYPQEHPMTFLTRIQTNLESTEDMNSKFLLRAIEEKLVKNLDNATNIELQRLLTTAGRTSLTFDKLKESLQKAITLTGFRSDNSVNHMGEEILTAINDLKGNMNRCYICHSPNHIASKCNNGKGSTFRSKNKKKEGSRREPKDTQDGSCFYCKKSGHWKRNCRLFKEHKAQGKIKRKTQN